MEKLIFQALQQINEKLDQQSKKLDHQSETLNLHGEILMQHGDMLMQHGDMLMQHGETLKEHGQILSALRTGQESLKAEISELRLQNGKDFGELREQIREIEANIGVLKEDNWTNRKDIHRVKKKMGME